MIVAPDKVTISGEQFAKAGATIKLKCVTGISNPAAKISWFARGQPITELSNSVVPSPLVIVFIRIMKNFYEKI